jgi:prevent-host-death family protein
VKRVNLAEAKAHLSKLVDEAAAGNPICIMRRGKPIAQIIAAELPRKPIDAAVLQRLTAGGRWQPESAGEFVRHMRDEERY